MNNLSFISKSKWLIILSALFIGIVSCKSTKLSPTPLIGTEMTVKLTVIQNQMPMSSKSSYVIIDIQPADSTFNENIRLIEISATSANGTWSSKDFDHKDFYGKGFKGYQNCSRDFNPSIGRSDFKLKIESESGQIKLFEIENIQVMTVQ